MLVMLFLLYILNFQFENSVNIFQMREESTLTFNITKFILIITHLLFFISVLSLEKVSHSNGFKFFLKKRKVNNFYTESKFLYLSTCQLHLGICLMDISNFTCFDFDPFFLS